MIITFTGKYNKVLTTENLQECCDYIFKEDTELSVEQCMGRLIRGVVEKELNLNSALLAAYLLPSMLGK